MSSTGTLVSKCDMDICAYAKKFVNLYNDSIDLRRNLIGVLYTDSHPCLIYNGNFIQGVTQISNFWNALPATQHEIYCLDAHQMEPGTNDKTIVTQVMGNANIGGSCRAYNQVLILIFDGTNYRIKSDSYRFME